MRTTGLLALFALFISGCATYRYEIASPDGPARPVEKQVDLVIPAPPAEVRVRQVDNYCVVMIENRTPHPLTLEGNDSTLVDPTGQTRAIATQLVPPGAFTKIVLPPLRQIDPRGPEFRIGFGMQVRTPESDDLQRSPPEAVLARYMHYGAGPVEYWEWSGAGSVRLVIGLKQDERLTRHEFVITRSRK